VRIKAAVGEASASAAAATRRKSGRRSLKKPMLTTIGSILGSRSVALAVKSCGRYQPPWARRATRPTARVLDVSFEMKSGRIVVAATNEIPRKNSATSATLTARFQR